jgi:NHLM bacteriocin system ABC transporter ATP-binding protein
MSQTSLATLFEQHGDACAARSGAPLALQGAAVWRVGAVPVDVFLARLDDAGRPSRALRALFRAEAGALLCGQPAAAAGWQLVAIGLPGATLLRLARERLGAAPAEAAAALGHWLAQTAAAPAWRGGRPAATAAPAAPAPAGAPDWDAVDDYHRALLAHLLVELDHEEDGEQRRLARKNARQDEGMHAALGRLAAILRPADGGAGQAADGPALLAACRLVGGAAGIEFSAPYDAGETAEAGRDALGEIVEASRVRRRRVALKGAWWRADHGHLLGFLADGQSPVALLRGAGGYTLQQPGGAARPLTAELAAGLAPFAFLFYRGFGAAAVELGDMLRFGAAGQRRELLLVAATGVAGGLLGMLTPLATGMLFDSVIPGAERGQLLQLTLMLLAAAFGAAMFALTQGFAMLRVEGRMDSAVQSAVWDRLLRLPTGFFRDYTAGDLAARAGGINSMRQILSGHTLHTLLSAVFALFNLVLLFYYNSKLALLAVALVAVALVFSVGAARLRLRHARALAAVEGRIAGLVFQLLGGIAKLRTTGAEGRAFANWARLYAQQQEHQFKAAMLNSAVAVFNSVFPTLSSMAIFFTIAALLAAEQGFSTGSFLAFNAAFGGFLGAMLGASAALASVLGVVPLYERAKPILRGATEVGQGRAQPGRLQGRIELNQVCFSYAADGPRILDEVTLRIEAGEFVALVGASGSGKSTLLRLLLGFEAPASGAVYYDDRDLAGLDLGAVRRQLGVVLQNGQLLAGDIFSNIIGAASALTLDDAWLAAGQAGIADDIRAMPMGMHTMVNDGGGTLSGGQRQRLLIARAIVNRPRILLFDEATSALDNRAQQMVSDSLDGLSATRVVVAHRLSTVVNADRILVMERGRVVESGSYTELLALGGRFSALAQRQIV